MTLPLAIFAKDIRKTYGVLKALQGVSLAVPCGQVFTILGPNGAGKTTLIKILTTLTRPDSGTAQVMGLDIARDPIAVRASIGVVSQDNHFETYFTVFENLKLHAELHGMRRKDYEPRIDELLTLVDLYDRRNAVTDSLSGGMQRRVCLVRALIHRPQVLFLDEPTTGLDPVSRRQMWDTINSLKSEATIILTTHYMEEAEVLSDTIMMMNRGQVVMQGSPRALKASLSPQDRYRILLRQPQARQVLQALSKAHYITEGHVEDEYRATFGLVDGVSLSQVLGSVDSQAFERLGRVENDLEALFVAVAAQEVYEPGESPA